MKQKTLDKLVYGLIIFGLAYGIFIFLIVNT